MSSKPPVDGLPFGVGRAAELRRHTPNASSPRVESARSPEGAPSPPSYRRPQRSRLVLLELLGSEPGKVFSIQQRVSSIGRRASADVHLKDVTVSWEHARITVEGDSVYIEDLMSRNGTFVNSLRIEGRCRLVDGDYLQLGGESTVVKFSEMDKLEEDALRTLFQLTLRDSLTRLYNRRYFDERLLAEFAFAQRNRSQLALLLIDIDHFKHFNDAYGHQVGDAVLHVVTGSLQKMMRPEDVLARYGGEEFVIIARNTSLRNAHILGERLCQQVRSLSLSLPDKDQGVTVSIGASSIEPEGRCSSAEGLLRAADLALFEAKSAGRDRTCSASPQA